MPKKKEVHLKKLIHAAEEPGKEPEMKVQYPSDCTEIRNRKRSLLCHIGIQI